MRTARPALTELGPVVVLREHPGVARTLRRETERGNWTTLLPGIVVPSAAASDVLVRAQAACRWNPDAVVLGAAAARLGFWPDLPVATMELSVRVRPSSRWFTGSERSIDPDHVVHGNGVRFASPALAAIDLCPRFGGDAIDRLLRSRADTLAALWEVLRRYPKRRGNTERTRLLLDSRDEPWSEAERLFHRLLRGAGLTGWRANYPVRCFERRYFIDVAFPGAKLAIEIDGRIHSGPDLFESDRERQADLVAAGWRVIRFTWAQLQHRPEWVMDRIRRALAR